MIPNLTVRPAPVVAILARNSAKLLTGLPSIEMMISPDLIPASFAAESFITSLTKAPFCTSRSKALAISEVNSLPLIPNTPRLTSPYSISCEVKLLTMLLGIAKPIPTLPPLGAIIAVFIPTSSPFKLTKAPPELP